MDEPLESADHLVTDQTKQSGEVGVPLIEDGLTIHMRALGFIVKSARWSDQNSVLRVTLLTRSFNTCHIAYRSLMWGYYSQAFMLLRSALDDWLAERYVRARPHETRKWIDADLPPPARSTRMACLGKQDRIQLQKLFHRLHSFDHPGRLGVWAVMEARPSGGYLRLGGHFEATELRLVIGPFLHALSRLHNSLAELTLDMNLQIPAAWHESAQVFDRRATQWLDQFNAEALARQKVRESTSPTGSPETEDEEQMT